MKKYLVFLWILCLPFLIFHCDDETTVDNGQWPTEAWEENSLDDVGINSTLIQSLVDDIENGIYGNIHSLLIVRDKYLVSENYFNNSDAEHSHQLQSAGKSIASVLAGIAMDQGYMTEQDHILDLMQSYTVANRDNLKEQITVKNVLNMKHGLLWREWGYSSDNNDAHLIMNQPDWVQYVLDRPMETTPGTKFNYSTGVSVLISGMIDELTPLKTDEFANTYLFDPIGITSDKWWVRDSVGHVHTGGGLNLTARDMARFGLLVLNDGNWDDTQIVSKGYLERSFIVDTKNAITLAMEDELISMHYGYHWWIYPIQLPNGSELNVYTALGWGGQSIFIVEDYNMVVVSTAWNDTTYPAVGFFKNRILPAVDP